MCVVRECVRAVLVFLGGGGGDEQWAMDVYVFSSHAAGSGAEIMPEATARFRDVLCKPKRERFFDLMAVGFSDGMTYFCPEQAAEAAVEVKEQRQSSCGKAYYVRWRCGARKGGREGRMMAEMRTRTEGRKKEGKRQNSDFCLNTQTTSN